MTCVFIFQSTSERLPFSWFGINPFEKLPIEQVGEVFLAIMHYAKDGTIPTLEPLPNLCFSFIKSQIDRDKDKYENIKRKRAESGKKGGQKRAENLAANQANQAKPSIMCMIMIM